ncbi:hypothetical protein B0H10DRAFT_2094637 [Mycena sp. CBHHK59/15]|nr:hypothetical protein B0H10DRAFT_2094637 [Mycena sp. CBHHK59/15]
MEPITALELPEPQLQVVQMCTRHTWPETPSQHPAILNSITPFPVLRRLACGLSPTFGLRAVQQTHALTVRICPSKMQGIRRAGCRDGEVRRTGQARTQKLPTCMPCAFPSGFIPCIAPNHTRRPVVEHARDRDTNRTGWADGRMQWSVHCESDAHAGPQSRTAVRRLRCNPTRIPHSRLRAIRSALRPPRRARVRQGASAYPGPRRWGGRALSVSAP